MSRTIRALSFAIAAVPAFAQTPSPTPSCSSATTTGGSDSTMLPIVDQTLTTSTITISGANPYTWDVELSTAIAHAASGDLDITLTSPSGTVAVISTANGGANDDVFHGTQWDDQAGDDPCTDHGYANFVTATPLEPEGSFEVFRGEDPNGVWTLGILDTRVGNTGDLHQWSLAVKALNAAPVNLASGSIASSDVPKAINDMTVASSTNNVSGLATFITDVDLFVDVSHTFSSDLEIRLTSPAGTVVTITTDNGGGLNNVFAGTTFDDGASEGADDHAYVTNVTATPLSPEGSLSRLVGEDPNGTWTLAVGDDRLLNTGTLNAWSLFIETGGAVPAPIASYCTSGTSQFACVPTMSFVQINPPSISAGSGFTVSCTGMDGGRNGGMYYGLGAAAQPISLGSSFLCTTAPRQRLLSFPANQTGGTLGSCNGTLSVDLNAYIASHPASLGAPYVGCQTLYLQAFNRDPGNASKNLVFSDGLAVTLNP